MAEVTTNNIQENDAFRKFVANVVGSYCAATGARFEDILTTSTHADVKLTINGKEMDATPFIAHLYAQLDREAVLAAREVLEAHCTDLENVVIDLTQYIRREASTRLPKFQEGV